jgi:hypothetical protein
MYKSLCTYSRGSAIILDSVNLLPTKALISINQLHKQKKPPLLKKGRLESKSLLLANDKKSSRGTCTIRQRDDHVVQPVGQVQVRDVQANVVLTDGKARNIVGA